MDIYLIPELELNRKLEVELDRKLELNNCGHPIPELELDRKLELDNCGHPIPELELELDQPFIKELKLDNYGRSLIWSEEKIWGAVTRRWAIFSR